MVSKSKVVRVELEENTGSGFGRFSSAYAEGTHGKSAFMQSCITGGFLLKEAGLLDTLELLDKDQSYSALTPLQKRAKIINLIAPGIVPAFTSLPVSEEAAPAIEPAPAPAPAAAAVPVHQVSEEPPSMAPSKMPKLGA